MIKIINNNYNKRNNNLFKNIPSYFCYEIHQKHLSTTIKTPTAGKQSGNNVDGLSTVGKPPTTIGIANKPIIEEIHQDYIGPPDKQSNLRPILRHIAINESALEYKLRMRRQEIEQFNQNFWSKHNKRFYEEKESFIMANKGNQSEESMSADKMSEFYKRFLDKNWNLHFYYNISWYLKNLELLMLSFQTMIHTKLFKK